MCVRVHACVYVYMRACIYMYVRVRVRVGVGVPAYPEGVRHTTFLQAFITASQGCHRLFYQWYPQLSLPPLRVSKPSILLDWECVVKEHLKNVTMVSSI